MDCFKIKLLLRNGYHSHEQDYPVHVFEHLFICRSCWAYANYLWHREAEELARKQQTGDAEHLERLEKIWASRHRHGKPGAAAWLVEAASGALSPERKIPH